MENNAPDLKTEHARWDLSLLYTGVDDPQIDKDIADLVAREKKFCEDHKGTLAEKLGGAITDLMDISMLAEKIFGYLYLKQSLNVADAAVKAKMAEAERIASEAIGNYLTFFDIELVALDDVTLAKLYASDALVARHRPWIEHARVFKPHLLSEPVEAALSKRSPFGPASWAEFFDEVEADLRMQFRGAEKTLTEMLDVLTNSKDAAEREEALALINAELGGYFAKYSAQSLYMVAGEAAVERRERGYKNPMDSRNKSNRVPDAVVDALHEAVTTTAGPLARRYYALKAKLLGMDKLKWSDRNAPMPFADTTIIPFDAAMETVLAAYASFSPTLAGLVKDFADTHRIDAPVTKGRRGGAYNYSIVLPGNRPTSYVFMNYLGSSNDVMTLAHELGHGVHGMLAGQAQGALMMHAPTAYAETASVFGEMTTFTFLKGQREKSGDTKALLALVADKIEGNINTIVRQIGFSNFERRLHGMDAAYKTWGEPKKFSPAELDAIWLQTLKEFYGAEGEVFTYEDTEHLWTYVNHFHRPFYVYGYAFGELLTQSLYAERPRLGDTFEPLYLDLLRSGSTRDAVGLLAPFGLDPTNKDFWKNGITVSLAAMVQEAEELAKKL
ncbi:MAG TPA: M3 family oligoendopeptidase [Candidatus Paceibacterota bacterium]|nr:M3 family oligoendopeptidase [Candidatus Paceibacterota bacterium]